MNREDKSHEPISRYTFEIEKGKIFRKIDENHQIQSEKIGKLEIAVNRQITLQEAQTESQKKAEKHLENLNSTMSKVGEEVIHIKYKVKAHDDTLQSVSGALSEKQKGNATIAVGIISTIGSIIAAAIAVAPLLFN